MHGKFSENKFGYVEQNFFSPLVLEVDEIQKNLTFIRQKKKLKNEIASRKHWVFFYQILRATKWE